MRCHWWSNGFQLHLCESQICVVTGGATAFNYTCSAKYRIALSLEEQQLSITLVRITDLRCHRCFNGFQLHFFCEAQNCVVTGVATAFNYIWSAKHRITLSLVEQRLSITLVRSTGLRCHWCCNGFQLHLVCHTQNCVFTGGATAFNYTCAKQNCVVTGGVTAFNYTCAKHRVALSLVGNVFQ